MKDQCQFCLGKKGKDDRKDSSDFIVCPKCGRKVDEQLVEDE